MKRSYSTPVIEKITFDYKDQISCTTASCFGSVINVSVGTEVCGLGTPFYIGWNSRNPRVFTPGRTGYR